MIGGSFNRLRGARAGKWGKGAAVVLLGLVALDLAATLVTLAIGSEFLKK